MEVNTGDLVGKGGTSKFLFLNFVNFFPLQSDQFDRPSNSHHIKSSVRCVVGKAMTAGHNTFS